MPKKYAYIVTGLSPVKSDGEMKGEGDEIMLSQNEGDELVRLGVLATYGVKVVDTSSEIIKLSEVDPLITTLVEAIGQLEPGNKDHWTSAGKAEIKALSKITGVKKITAAQRDEAFELFQDKHD